MRGKLMVNDAREDEDDAEEEEFGQEENIVSVESTGIEADKSMIKRAALSKRRQQKASDLLRNPQRRRSKNMS